MSSIDSTFSAPRRLGTAIAIAFLCALTLVSSADAKRLRIPNTTIASGPAEGSTISDTTPTFAFTSSLTRSLFECKVDSASFASCTSPRTTAPLADGAHTFSVRAIRLGILDPTPATRTFIVDTTPEPAPPPPEETTPPPPSGAIPTSWRRSASFETDLTSGTDGWHIADPFVISRTNAVGGSRGSYAARIVTNGGNSGCSCPRTKFEDGFSLGAGEEVWFGGSWLIPSGASLATSRLLNLGHWVSGGSQNWNLAVQSNGQGTFQVEHQTRGSNATSYPLVPLSLPRGRWFDLDIHARLSPTDGQGLTEVYLDGQLVGTTTKRNMTYNQPLHFYNGGIPYFYPGNGNVTVYFDAARLTY